MKFGSKGGFLTMILSVLGIVLFATMFDSIMTALGTLYSATGASTFIAFQTVVGIAPTVLLLGGTIGAGYAYFRGYQAVSSGGGDTGGMLRVVLGALVLILFVTLFDSIVDAIYPLYTSYGSNTSYIAFGTVLKIVPTVMFLAGIFAGGATAVGGYRARRRRRALI